MEDGEVILRLTEIGRAQRARRKLVLPEPETTGVPRVGLKARLLVFHPGARQGVGEEAQVLAGLLSEDTLGGWVGISFPPFTHGLIGNTNLTIGFLTGKMTAFPTGPRRPGWTQALAWPWRGPGVARA